MNEAPERVLAVFTEALSLPVAERSGYLDRVCAGDGELRRRVESLLGAFDKAGNFLGEPAPSTPTGTGQGLIAGEKPGDEIGPYKLLQQIGEGGCGVVFMAEQEAPVRRRVAVKVVKPGMDSKNVIARFEAERQALALMEHPNIAHVFDAGTTGSGRPYFVMELIRGIKITDYCDQNSLTTIQRLELFTEVCNAVQHAHQKGIIHRDIKPSNILVTTSAEGKPEPKVIDFGIAKATTGQRLTDNTVFTAFEMLIGTPAYMSPEQAALTSVDVDTRSDIYSLGVLLYELLTGTTPFDTRELLKSGLDEVRRVIQTEEPVRPSTRLRTMLAADLTAVSGQRKAQPPNLIREVRGDLDWIVMKALEKDRTRRYQTSGSLAEDVQHYLANETVCARPPSTTYKIHKLVLRNKLLFAGLGVMLVVLLAALGVTSWSLSKEKQAHLKADAARKKAQMNERQALLEVSNSVQVTRFLKDMLQSVGPSVAEGRDTTMLREILDNTAERVGKELTNQPVVEAELQHQIGNVYDELGEHGKAEDMERHALAIYRTMPAAAESKMVEVLFSLSMIHRMESRFEEADKESREALALEIHRTGEETLHVVQLEAELALVTANRGDKAASEALYRKALAKARRIGPEPSSETVDTLNGLAMVLQMEGKHPEAEGLLRNALDQSQKLYGSNSPSSATAMYNLASVLIQEKKLAESERIIRQCVAIRRNVLGGAHPWFADALQGLGSVLLRERKWEEAEKTFVELLAIRRKLAGNQDPRVLEAFLALQDVYAAEHKEAEADRAFDEMLAASVQDSRQAGRLWESRAEILARHSQWPGAADAAAHALELLPDDPVRYHTLAPLLVETGNREAYAELCGKITAHFRGSADPQVADKMAKDCLILPQPGADLQVAGQLADTAVTLGEGTPPYALFECCKALAEYRVGHWDEAVTWAQRASVNNFPYSHAESYAVLAMAECKLKQNEEARRALAKCSEIVETQMPKMEGGDLGGDWRDWIIAHALLAEARSMIQVVGLPNNNSLEK